MKTALLLALTAMPAFAASGPPDFDIRGVIWFVVQLLGVGIIFGLLHLGVQRAPFIGEPFKAILMWVILALGILIAIYVILRFIGL